MSSLIQDCAQIRFGAKTPRKSQQRKIKTIMCAWNVFCSPLSPLLGRSLFRSRSLRASPKVQSDSSASFVFEAAARSVRANWATAEKKSFLMDERIGESQGLCRRRLATAQFRLKRWKYDVDSILTRMRADARFFVWFIFDVPSYSAFYFCRKRRESMAGSDSFRSGERGEGIRSENVSECGARRFPPSRLSQSLLIAEHERL